MEDIHNIDDEADMRLRRFWNWSQKNDDNKEALLLPGAA